MIRLFVCLFIVVAGIWGGVSGIPAYAEDLWWPYGQMYCPSIHIGPANSDYSSIDPPITFQEAWYTLKGDSTLTGQVIDNIRNRIYVTTGKDNQPNLYAYTAEGQLLWTSDSWSPNPGDPKLSYCSSASAAIIDDGGNIYLSDCAYLWASDSNGTLLWKKALPAEADGKVYPFVTAFFTRTGQVGGVTTAGRLVVFDRLSTNSSESPLVSYQLPGILVTPQPVDTESTLYKLLDQCMWKSGDKTDPYMLSPNITPSYLKAFLGVGSAVSNTPAVQPDPLNPNVSRIFIPGILELLPGQETYSVRLYRIDFTYHAATNTATASVPSGFDGMIPNGIGSATSPDVSADGTRIYVGDNTGVLRAFHIETGAQIWSTFVGNMLGSVGTAMDGTGRVNVATEKELAALDGANGTILWQRDYNYLAEQMIPPIDQNGDGVEDFKRMSMPAGVAVTTPSYIMMPFTIGYLITDLKKLAVWPMKSILALIDRVTGDIVGTPYELRDVSETGAINDPGGYMYVTHSSAMSSMAACLYANYLEYQKTLPEPMSPSGGFEVLKAKGPVQIEAGARYTKTPQVTMTINQTLAAQICISNEGPCTIWIPVSAQVGWTLSAGDGVKTVYVTFNTGTSASGVTYSDTIVLDTVTPVDGTIGGTVEQGKILLSWDGFTDPTSGVYSYILVYSTTSAPVSCEAGTVVYRGSWSSFTHTTATDGQTYYYRVCAVDGAGNRSAGVTTTVPTSCNVTFGDVPENYWAGVSIDHIYCNGVTLGCSANPLLYCPVNSVSRAQMAAFIIRAIIGDFFLYPETPYFADVPVTHWAFRYVQKMRALGITSGCMPDNPSTVENEAMYCPEDNVLREQMAVFIVRAKNAEKTAYCTGNMFADVKEDSFYCRYIERLAQLGITQGCANDDPATLKNEALYCPTGVTSRSEMAVFIERGFY